MDLSKLPKLSDTKSQISDEPAVPVENAVDYQPAARVRPNIGGDVWISLVLGALFIFLGINFARYAGSAITHHPFHTGVNWTSGPKEGSEVSYFDLDGFTAWSEMGIFFFGVTLVFEALAKTLITLRPSAVSRVGLMLAMLLTGVAVLINVVACVKMFGGGITPLISVLAVAFGGWILLDEWSTLRRVGSAH